MFGHLPEFFIIMVIALIVFGPEKLPEVAANAGRWVREAREVLDSAMNPETHDHHDVDDFSTYYYESLARSGEEGVETTEHTDLEYEEPTSEHADTESFPDVAEPLPHSGTAHGLYEQGPAEEIQPEKLDHENIQKG